MNNKYTMKYSIILDKKDQSIYTDSILNVFNNPFDYYILAIRKKNYRTHTKSSLKKIRFSIY